MTAQDTNEKQPVKESAGISDEAFAAVQKELSRLKRENHSIRARMSAVQTQIQEINQVNEILLYVQQQIMASMTGITDENELNALFSGIQLGDDNQNN